MAPETVTNGPVVSSKLSLLTNQCIRCFSRSLNKRWRSLSCKSNIRLHLSIKFIHCRRFIGSYGAGNDWPFSQPAHLVLPKVCHQFPGRSASSPCCRFWTCAPTVSVWLLTGCAWYCERLGELGPAASTEASHRACQERLRDLVNRTKNRALVHIACLENQASWTNVEQAFLKVTEGLNSLTNQTLRGKLEVCISLVKSIPTIVLEQSDPLHHSSFPSVHAFMMLEGTMNLSLDWSRARFRKYWSGPKVGPGHVRGGSRVVRIKLKKYPQGENQDLMDDVNIAFKYPLKLTPLLDMADQQCITSVEKDSSSVRALLFDISFFMQCHGLQTYGSEVILSDLSPSEESKTLNPDHPCFRMESGKVESLVALLNNATELKLVSHVRMLGLDEREKPQTMIRQLMTPLYEENTLQFYNEGRRLARSGPTRWCSCFTAFSAWTPSRSPSPCWATPCSQTLPTGTAWQTRPARPWPSDRSMSTSLSASQLHTVNMRDPLNHVLANLFLLISSVLGSKTAGPHTQFVQSFMKECVECLEQGSCGSILQFMPFTMVEFWIVD
nr:mediator of RNA polymerase II transcription subunit 24-like [Oncorhynchus nerka]